MKKVNISIAVLMFIFLIPMVRSIGSYRLFNSWVEISSTAIPVILTIIVLLLCLAKASSDRRLYLLNGLVSLTWAVYYFIALSFGFNLFGFLGGLLPGLVAILSFVTYAKCNRLQGTNHTFWLALGFSALFLGFKIDNMLTSFSGSGVHNVWETIFVITFLILYVAYMYYRVSKYGDLKQALIRGNRTLILIGGSWTLAVSFGPVSDAWNFGNSIVVGLSVSVILIAIVINSIVATIASVFWKRRASNT